MKITFIRHGQCYVNNDYSVINPPLNVEGIENATNVIGHYDYLIVSPLQRTMDTRKYSKITANKEEISLLFREHIINPCDTLSLEEIPFESKEKFRERIEMIIQHLRYLKTHKKITNLCVISHSVLLLYLLRHIGIDLQNHLKYCEEYVIEF